MDDDAPADRLRADRRRRSAGQSFLGDNLMVLPLFDDNSQRRRFPFVNYAFIALNVFVFIVLQQAGATAEGEKFTYAFSVVPEEIITGHDISGPVDIQNPITNETVGTIELEPTPFTVYITLLTSMFMHGGWAHLLGNMLFLWIFGDNVEDYLGHFRYIVFYGISGVLASLAHVAWTIVLRQDPYIPSLGASGAISGVLGGYLILYPHNRVTVILFRILTDVPAYVAIGIWFVFQIIESLGVLGGHGGGVAYGAHIGGFVAGVALIKMFALGQPEPRWRSRVPHAPGRFGRTPW